MEDTDSIQLRCCGAYRLLTIMSALLFVIGLLSQIGTSLAEGQWIWMLLYLGSTGAIAFRGIFTGLKLSRDELVVTGMLRKRIFPTSTLVEFVSVPIDLITLLPSDQELLRATFDRRSVQRSVDIFAVSFRARKMKQVVAELNNRIASWGHSKPT